ncbi:MAG: redoxin family protein [Pirellulales bacterium]
MVTQLPRRRAVSFSSRWNLLFAASMFAPILAGGCGGSDEPITAQKSQYEVGDDNGASGAAGAESARPSSPSDSGEPAPGDSDSGATGSEAPAAGGATNVRPPVRPPMSTGDDADAPAPPRVAGKKSSANEGGLEGTPEELLARLVQLERKEPSGRNNRELLENIREWLDLRLKLADKLLSSEASEEQRLVAARAKKVILIQMTQAGMPDIDKALKQFCIDLIKSEGASVQQLGRITQLEMQLAKLFAGATEDYQAVVDAISAALEGPNRDEELFNSVASASIALQQTGQPDASLSAMKVVEEAFKETKNERIAAMLSRLGELRSLLESGIDSLADGVVKDEPMATEKFLAAVDKLVADKPGGGLLEKISFLAQQFEYTRRYELAGHLYNAIEKGYKEHADAEIAKRATAAVAVGRKRMELLGKPFVVEGKDIEGQPFDWKPYEGKIVLVDFWATWCGPCQKEIPNIKRNFDRYHEMGFEVVGVNLDQERADLDRFLTVQPLPWATVVDANSFAERCGVESIPFVVLVGRDGRVLDLHVRGEALGQRLEELFNPDAKPAAKKEPAEGDAKPAKPEAKPSDEKPAEDKPAAEKPAEAKPEQDQGARRAPRVSDDFVGVGLDDVSPFLAQPAPQAGAATKAPAANAASNAQANGAPAAGGPKLPDVNPYAPRADLKPLELIDFMERMLDKPKSIRGRPGFSEAIVIAADRLLANPEVTDRFKLIAITNKIEVLHAKAVEGDAKADEQLSALIDSLEKDERPSIAKSVRFLALERKTQKMDSEVEADVVKLLGELKQFYTDEKLEAKHLRMASNTVRLINKIANADTREKYFAEFGGMFAKSADRTLARYGKKLATPPESSESDLVGKELELAGRTLGGEDFQWEKYRGKVVLVDFWATWCGPCIREMPNVKALHEKYSARGFDIVGISLDQDLDALAEFNNQHKLPWTTLAGEENQELAKRYGVRGIPTMMLVDKQGKVVGVAHRVQELADKIEQLLKSS